MDPFGLFVFVLPLDTIWDAANVAYDIIVDDKEALALDTAALLTPYVPAGITKIGKLFKAIGNACGIGTAAKRGYNILDDAANLIKLNGGKNSVTIETTTQKIRYDLAGKAHGGVPTPHMQIYNKNFVSGVQKSVSRASKDAIPMTQKDMEIVRRFLTGQ